MYDHIVNGLPAVLEALEKLGRDEAATPEVSLAAGFAAGAVYEAQRNLQKYIEDNENRGRF